MTTDDNQGNVSIKTVINNIKIDNYVLPDLQREFVWPKNKILDFFDSIMRGYPIGSLLLWKVKEETVEKSNFYRLLKEYDESKIKQNTIIENPQKDIIAILDGQQRLTAIYLGFNGSYTEKIKKELGSGEKKYLYLNLLSKKTPPKKTRLFEFNFLTAKQANKTDENTIWFKVADIFKISENEHIGNYLETVLKIFPANKDNYNRSHSMINALWNKIDKSIIHSFYVEDQNIETVCEIFKRVNNGGTKLTKTDMMLALTAKDAAHISLKDHSIFEPRFHISELTNKINQDYGISIDKDFILKTCLVLIDSENIAFNSSTYVKDGSAIKIGENWDKISNSINLTFRLIKQMGYDDKTLTQHYPLIAITYYLYNKNRENDFLTRKTWQNERDIIKKWLMAAILKKIFPDDSDAALKYCREEITHATKFPLNSFLDKNSKFSLIFSDDEIKDFLKMQYPKDPIFTFFSFISPMRNPDLVYHEDHLHPQSIFSAENGLSKNGIPDDQIKQYISLRHNIANITILSENQNKAKSDKSLKEWINTVFKSKSEKDNFMTDHSIPDVDLDLKNFFDFIKERQKLIHNKFKDAMPEFVDTKKRPLPK